MLLSDGYENRFLSRQSYRLHWCFHDPLWTECYFYSYNGVEWTDMCCLYPLTLCLSMELRKSKWVWSEIPPWTIRIFPSMTVATGRRLKTSWNSWRISRPWVYTQLKTKETPLCLTHPAVKQNNDMYLDFTAPCTSAWLLLWSHI